MTPPRRAVVVVASTRAAAGVYEDLTGPAIAEWLTGRGFAVTGPQVVPDGPEVEAAFRAAVADGVDLVVSTGGTGVSADDVTPEATARVLDRELPGFSEELRRRGMAATPTALMSRGRAGIADRTFVVNLPGSAGGVRDGLGLLGEILDHVLGQVAGRDDGHGAHGHGPHHHHHDH